MSLLLELSNLIKEEKAIKCSLKLFPEQEQSLRNHQEKIDKEIEEIRR